MESNKKKWEDRHKKGMTRVDVATGVQKEADAARIAETVAKANRKSGKYVVDAEAEAAANAEAAADGKAEAAANAEAAAEIEIGGGENKTGSRKAGL